MARYTHLRDISIAAAPSSTTTGLKVGYLLDWEEGRAPITDGRRLRVTYQVYAPGGKHAPHQHEHIEQAYYILSGTGRVHVDDEVAEVGPGMMVYIPPKTNHHIENTGREELVHLLINVNLADGEA